MQLGNPEMAAKQAADAAARDEAVRPALVEMQAKGTTSRAMAQALTERGHEPPRGARVRPRPRRR